MATLRMRNASGHNYRNSSYIVDLAIGQISHSTEHISNYTYTAGTFVLSLLSYHYYNNYVNDLGIKY